MSAMSSGGEAALGLGAGSCAAITKIASPASTGRAIAQGDAPIINAPPVARNNMASDAMIWEMDSRFMVTALDSWQLCCDGWRNSVDSLRFGKGG